MEAGDNSVSPQEVAEIPSTMKAVIYTKYGHNPRELLSMDESHPVPKVPKNGVLIRVHAAAINPIDWKMMTGMLGLIQFSPFPFTPGFDVSGVVVSVGPKCKHFHLGDEVYAMASFQTCGTFAEYVACSEHLVSKKPKTLSHAEAATVPLAALTSYQSLVHFAKIKEGHKVLILGGSGGTGSWGIQFAKQRGCYVATTCSEKNVEYVQSLGADQVIDYGKEDWGTVLAGQDFDAIYDCVGGLKSWLASEKVLKKDGYFVTLTGDSETEQKMSIGGLLSGIGTKWARNIKSAFTGSPHYDGILTNANGKELGEIAEMIDDGKIKIVSFTAFPFDQFVALFEMSMSKHARGKLVLLVAPEEQDKYGAEQERTTDSTENAEEESQEKEDKEQPTQD